MRMMGFVRFPGKTENSPFAQEATGKFSFDLTGLLLSTRVHDGTLEEITCHMA